MCCMIVDEVWGRSSYVHMQVIPGHDARTSSHPIFAYKQFGFDILIF